ncbi:MAG: reverse transcriptase domain-containing protein [Microscillaceae bacterium]|nr:reverse transcriptase domain-containing protein [Microscillaceae bacterium]
MKSFKHLYPQIYAFENLWRAAKQAQKGKRYQANVLDFNLHLEQNLFELQHQLQSQTYQPGTYTTFYIYEPKKRMISAAPYRDRVVHHALCNVIAPIFERSFIFDSYANRKGKGTHKAILRYQAYTRNYRYVLRCDIARFFPSIDHQILKALLFRKIVCEPTQRLISRIIDNSNLQEQTGFYFPGDDLFTPGTRRKGLPIGNLTSQFWANVYMNPLDHFIKDDLGLPYLRYVDDFVVFGQDKAQLQELKNRIRLFLYAYRLHLHPSKSRVHQTWEGLLFLGHRVFSRYRLLHKENLRRFRKRLKHRISDLQKGKITPAFFQNSIQSWLAHAAFSNTYRLRQKILTTLASQGLYGSNESLPARG